MIVTLPAPNAFPVGSSVRAGEYQGQVTALRGPYSVTIREHSGRLLTTTTSDMEIDLEPASAEAPQPVSEPAQFSLL